MVIVIKRGMKRKQINTILDRNKRTTKKKLELEKYCGILKLSADPLDIQKELRNEWK